MGVPDHRSTGRRNGEPGAYASPQSPHALDDASADELRGEWWRLYYCEPPSKPPTMPPIMAKMRYRVPMSLWLVEKSQRRHPVG